MPRVVETRARASRASTSSCGAPAPREGVDRAARPRRAALRARRRRRATRAAGAGASTATLAVLDAARRGRRAAPPTLPGRARARRGRRSRARPPATCCSRAAPGYEFPDWGGVDHVGGGSHGSLHASTRSARWPSAGSTPPHEPRRVVDRRRRADGARATSAPDGRGAERRRLTRRRARASHLPAAARAVLAALTTSGARRPAPRPPARPRRSTSLPAAPAHADDARPAQAAWTARPRATRLTGSQALAIADRDADRRSARSRSAPGLVRRRRIEKSGSRWQVSYYVTRGKAPRRSAGLRRRRDRAGARGVDRAPGRVDDGARLPGRVRAQGQRAVRLAAAARCSSSRRSSTPRRPLRMLHLDLLVLAVASGLAGVLQRRATSTSRCRSPIRRCSTCSARMLWIGLRRGRRPRRRCACSSRRRGWRSALRLPGRLPHRAERRPTRT